MSGKFGSTCQDTFQTPLHAANQRLTAQERSSLSAQPSTQNDKVGGHKMDEHSTGKKAENKPVKAVGLNPRVGLPKPNHATLPQECLPNPNKTFFGENTPFKSPNFGNLESALHRTPISNFQSSGQPSGLTGLTTNFTPKQNLSKIQSIHKEYSFKKDALNKFPVVADCGQEGPPQKTGVLENSMFPTEENRHLIFHSDFQGNLKMGSGFQGMGPNMMNDSSFLSKDFIYVLFIILWIFCWVQNIGGVKSYVLLFTGF